MSLDELYNTLKEEVSFDLIGNIINEGMVIKWEYDSFNAEFQYDEEEDEHLERIYNDDLDLIKEVVSLEDFNVSEPIIEDTYISFYIEE